jgi:hypothetical protein
MRERVLCFVAIVGVLASCGGDAAVAPVDAGADASLDGASPADAYGEASAALADGGLDATIQGNDASQNMGPDASMDATPDAQLDAGVDAHPDSAADAAADVAPDAPADAGQPVQMLLTAVGLGSTPPAFGSTYQGGSWSALTNLTPSGSDESPQHGGGVVYVPDGRAVVVLRSATWQQFETAAWSGSWPMLASPPGGDAGANLAYLVSRPVATPTGAIAVHQGQLGNSSFFFDTFDETTSSWTLGEPTSAPGDSRTPPVVSATAAGDPVVLFVPTRSDPATYEFTERTGGVWSPPAAVPGAALNGTLGNPPHVAAAKRLGADQVVAVFLGGTNGGDLLAATFSGGVWSAVTTIASDVMMSGYGMAALDALPDGRVVLAYTGFKSGSTGNVEVGFFDGAAWSALRSVPMVGAGSVYVNLAVAHGAPGAVVELVFIDVNGHLRHTRLTNEAGWTWTAPAIVDDSKACGLVSIAVL